MLKTRIHKVKNKKKGNSNPLNDKIGLSTSQLNQSSSRQQK